MSENMEALTPAQIVAELDKYIVGQKAAKRAVAVALRDRYRRRRLPTDMRDEVIPKNILMIGSTGVGKTEIARRLAVLARAPFLKVEATKFTEVGYVGRNVDSMVRDLVQMAIRLVENEKVEAVRPQAEERAIQRILDILQPFPSSRSKRGKQSESEHQDVAHAIRQMLGQMLGQNVQTAAAPQEESAADIPPTAEQSEEARQDKVRVERIRERIRGQLLSGALDNQEITIELMENQPSPFMQMFPAGMEEMDSGEMPVYGPKRSKARKTTIGEARELLAREEAQNLIDREGVTQEAIQRAEQDGIIFVDEIDKIAGGSGHNGPNVSREGVQRDILPIIEGSTVSTRYGPVKTDHVLFIAAGAFHLSRPSDLIPELQGRLPIRVELESLTEEDFQRILTEPKNALTRQYAALLATEGIVLEFQEDAIQEIAKLAAEVNRTSENIGARRLHTLMEKLLADVSFRAPDLESQLLCIDRDFVQRELADLVQSQDIGRYIL